MTVFSIAAMFGKRSKIKAAKIQKRFIVIIPAYKADHVVEKTVKAILGQTYPQRLFDVVVISDHQSELTNFKLAQYPITLLTPNFKYSTKGKSLQYAIKNLPEFKIYDIVVILDADNLLTPNYMSEMNKVYDKGYRASTSYRNSKNYAQNWISSGYGLWFLREAEYLNQPRYMLHTSCAISGTGFLVAADLIKERGGWHYHLLTEDIEFSVATVLTGERIGYAADAMLYDEQPITFKQSWNQRMRWAKGFYQVLGKHGRDLVKTFFRFKSGFFGSFDMLMNLTPALLVMLATLIFNLGMLIYISFFAPNGTQSALFGACLVAVLFSFGYYYCMLFLLGAVTTVSEWKKIPASTWMKIRTMFTFPLFMFTYMPIAVAALYQKVEWTPIEHTVVKSIDDMKNN